MSKMTISGPINAEAFEFAQSILTDLQGCGWVKDAIRAGLARDPDAAHDGALLIYAVMAERAGVSLDDES